MLRNIFITVIINISHNLELIIYGLYTMYDHLHKLLNALFKLILIKLENTHRVQTSANGVRSEGLSLQNRS